MDTEEISRNVEFKVSELGERSRIILVSKVTIGSVAEQVSLGELWSSLECQTRI